VHDKWIIRNLELYSNAVVEVFNRYGSKVFERRGYNSSNAWDGTMNGSPLPVGTYYYVIRLGTGKEPVGGFVAIIR
jgi:gliding motility-associated-like protein